MFFTTALFPFIRNSLFLVPCSIFLCFWFLVYCFWLVSYSTRFPFYPGRKLLYGIICEIFSHLSICDPQFQIPNSFPTSRQHPAPRLLSGTAARYAGSLFPSEGPAYIWQSVVHPAEALPAFPSGTGSAPG